MYKNVDDHTGLLNSGAANADAFINKHMKSCYNLQQNNEHDDDDDDLEENNYISASDSCDDNNFMSAKSISVHRPGVLDYFGNQDDIDVEYPDASPIAEFSRPSSASQEERTTVAPIVFDDYQKCRRADELKQLILQKKRDEEALNQRARVSLRSETAHNLKVRLNNDQRSDEQYDAVSADESESTAANKECKQASSIDLNTIYSGHDGLENVLVRNGDNDLYGIQPVCDSSLEWSEKAFGLNEEGWQLQQKYSKQHDKFSALNADFQNKERGRINSTSSNIREAVIDTSSKDISNKSVFDINKMDLTDPKKNSLLKLNDYNTSNKTFLSSDTKMSKKLRSSTVAKLNSDDMFINTSLGFPNRIDKDIG